MSIKKSQIKQAYNPIKNEKLDVFNKTMSPYLLGSNEFMQGFLKRLEMIKMNNYYSVKLLENLYNYTEDNTNK